ncbi:E3 ubiquitin-protein ligase RNF216 [Sporobolomyces salmoneus]|uniref:E3 ubiquitin-protein ligase RNF216 n=1 Tax=Sporobolomyces salmoneus TaxID=183962 RepID=UPI00316FDBB3
MLPWRPPGAADVPPPPGPLHQTEDPDSESDSEELAAPPRYYFDQLREIFPLCTRRDGLRAWDLSAKDNWKGASEQDRVQGAILKMEEVINPAPALLQQQTPSTAGTKRKIDEEEPGSSQGRGAANGADRKGKGKGKALFRPEDDDEDLEVVRADERAGDSAKKRKISAETGGNGSGKGKGKARSREADLVISDDDEDVVIVEAASSSPAGGKGKGKERRISTPAEVDITAERQQPQVAKAPTPEPPPSPLVQLLQLLPDLLPSHAGELLASPQFGNDLDKVMDHLLSIPGGYPKVPVEKEAEKEKDVDWGDVKARKRSEGEKSALYKRLALDQLYTDFALLPTTLIKSTFLSPEIASSYFAPAYLSLYTRSKAGEFNAQLLKNRRKPTKKITKWVPREEGENDGAGGGEAVEVEEKDEGLEKEMEWIKNKLLAQRKEKKIKLKLEKETQAEQERRAKLDEKAKKKGKAEECQCCFDQYALENTVPCEKGHRFCRDCAISNASHRIGDQHYTLPCMTDCDALFSSKDHETWMPEKMRATLERLQADKELEMAFEGVEGFEKCPFCPFAVYIENENERLFTCLREDCGKVSCRKCKKEGHVPLTCEEADRESRMGGVHAVEDAMTEAMIRSCPKCQLKYIKSEACNKITCSKCGALSCYICQAVVKDYSHFDQSAPGAPNGNSSKCPLWDDTDVRHFNEVEEARKKAQAELDPKTQEYAEKLAADKPDRQAPRYPAVAAYVPPWNARPLPLGPPMHNNPWINHFPPANNHPAQLPLQQARPDAAERAIAHQNAQIEALRRQNDIILENQQRVLAMQQRVALANAYAEREEQDRRARFANLQQAHRPPPLAPPPNDPEAARQARLDAIMRRRLDGV